MDEHIDIEFFSNKDFVKDVETMKCGSFGYVCRVEHPKRGEMAMKIFNDSKYGPNAEEDQLLEMSNMIEYSSHRHIVKCIGCLMEKNKDQVKIAGYVMEYMSEGSLRDGNSHSTGD